MKLKMAENSLFAILLRKPWWMSFGVAAGVVLAARLLLPEKYVIAGALGGIPFVIVGVIASWRQFQLPSTAGVASTIEAVGAMSWREFSTTLADAFRRDGYAVTPLAGPHADFEITKAGRTSLVACKRWKAASAGVEPLRDLHAAKEAREASEGIYVAVAGITDNARRFATDNRIRIIGSAELAQMLRGQSPARRGRPGAGA